MLVSRPWKKKNPYLKPVILPIVRYSHNVMLKTDRGTENSRWLIAAEDG